MKKRLWIAVTSCVLFALTGCGGSEPVYEDEVIEETYEEEVSEDEASEDTYEETEVSLESFAGWWTKPEGFDGITILPTFSVDAESGTVTSYDDYGNAYEVYECWYDEYGFAIDCGELFGVVTYAFDGEQLLDEEGTVHYVRSEPLSAESAPYTVEDLMGVWYKKGNPEEDYEQIVIDENGYHTQQLGIETGNGSVLVKELHASYNDSEHVGPIADLEAESGFMSSNPWILEDGKVLFDDFHEVYYIKDSVDEAERAVLCEKYNLIIDDWQNDEEHYYMNFSFYGTISLRSDEIGLVPETVGIWDYADGILYLEFEDGTTQEITPADEIFVDYCGVNFTRWKAW